MSALGTGRAGPQGALPLDRALRQIVAEVLDALGHGHFEFRLNGEVVTGGQRRLTLHAGKSYQFLIPKDACERPGTPVDPRHGGDHFDCDKDVGHRRHGEPATGSASPCGARAADDA